MLIVAIYVTVVSASLEFMDSDTMISEKKDTTQPITTMRKTQLLCQVTDPEEKRRIIGDTFMRVANEVSFWILGFINNYWVYNSSKNIQA